MSGLTNVPEGGMNGKRLTDDIQIVERMESDLRRKIQQSLATYNLGEFVFGVFSIDDLEKRQRSDLCGKMAIGIGYSGATPVPSEASQRGGALNPSGGTAAKSLWYEMTLIIATPTDDRCDERLNAVAVLAALRKAILGTVIAGDSSNRRWDFVREAPEVSASTDTMLYYTQVWRVAIQCVGM